MQQLEAEQQGVLLPFEPDGGGLQKCSCERRATTGLGVMEACVATRQSWTENR